MKYQLELLIIDSEGRPELSSLKSFVKTLEGADSLLLNPDADELGTMYHQNQDYEVQISSFYDEDIQEIKGYTISGSSDTMNTLVEQRGKLLSYLSHRMKLPYIKALGDDVSTYISVQILPLISKLEWALRKLIVQYYAYESGPQWWDKRAPSHLKKKLEQRHQEIASLQQLIDTNIEILTLEELGDIINNPNKFFLETFLTKQVLQLETIEELEELKEELTQDAIHPFQKAFSDNFFQEKWSTLLQLHRKVMHNQLMHPNDLAVGEQLYEALMGMIQNAKDVMLGEDMMDTTAIESNKQNIAEVRNFAESSMENSSFSQQASQQPQTPPQRTLKVINETELLHELKEAEKILEQTDMRYIGLKNFVTKILANKGFSIGPSYALVNILNEQGILEIYDYIDPNSPYPVKAVRSNL